MKIGGAELIVILIVALFIIGPDKLPVYARKLGKSLNSLKDTSNILAQEIRENVTEPLQEIVEPLQEVVEPVREIARPLDEATKSLRDIGKPRPKSVREAAKAQDAESTDAAIPEEEEEALYDASEESSETTSEAPVAEAIAEPATEPEPAAEPAAAEV